MDPNRAPGEPTMHLCHYPNCGKVYKVRESFILLMTAGYFV